MRIFRFNPLWQWAARDLLRRPYESILLVCAITLLIAFTAASLLVVQALSDTATELLKEGPSIVVRKISSGGWVPLPTHESLERAREVPGVINARARLWGVAAGPEGPVTVIGVDELSAKLLQSDGFSHLPQPGEAVIGQGVRADSIKGHVTLTGQEKMDFKIVDVLDSRSNLVTYDIVLLNEADARILMAIPPGFSSDIAIEVFHDEEEHALLPDLAAVFPWPVRITTRTEAIANYSAGWAYRGGTAVLQILPAVLAVALIVAATIRDHIGRKHEVGLLKALGWTTTDVVRLQMYRAILIALLAAALGMLLASLMAFWPGSPWVGFFLFGWKTHWSGLHLNTSGAVLVLLEVTAFLILPFLLATLLPTLKEATADPRDLFQSYYG